MPTNPKEDPLRQRWPLASIGVLCAVLGMPLPAAGQIIPAADPPYIPTPDYLVEAMLDMAGVSAGDVVYDLGSGDGRMVIAAAMRGAWGVGIEYEGWLVERSRARADSAGVGDRVEFRSEDLFRTDLRDATVVLIYLSPEFNLRLRPRLLAQLRPGARVVSHAFHMADWAPDDSVTIGSGAGRATLFAWRVPARVDGFWVLDMDGAAAVSLELSQRFQEIGGEARREGRAIQLERGWISADSVRFRLRQRLRGREESFEFRGILRGTTLTGTVDGPGSWGRRAWRAVRPTDPSLAPGCPNGPCGSSSPVSH